MAEVWDDVPPNAGLEVLQAFQRALDDRIASLEATLLTLKSRRNDLSQVSKLPPETLMNIFANLVEPPPYVCRQKRPDKARPAWLSASHISRTSRNLALGYQSLWANISARCGKEWISEMMIRAQDSPLSLDTTGIFNRATTCRVSDADLYKLAVAHAHQVAAIRLDFSDTHHGPIRGKWEGLIPQLSALHTLTFTEYTSRLDFLANTGVLPMLRSLRVKWNSLSQQPHPVQVLPQLKVLSLSGPWGQSQLNGIIAVLRHTKQLRRLSLVHLELDTLRPEVPQGTAAELPLLEHLYLQNVPSYNSAILSQLTLPPTTRIEAFISPSTVRIDN